MDTLFNQNKSEQDVEHEVLREFLDSYLVRRDAERTISLVTDDIYSLGTGVQEAAHNKEEFRKLIHTEMEQLSTPILYSLDSCYEKHPTPDIIVYMCDVTTTIRMDGQEPISYTTRLTAGFRKENGIYLAYHLHMSEASAIQQEYEFFPLHYSVSEAHKLGSEDQLNLVDLMKKMLPGGAMGGYVEPGFPLYFINDELLNWLDYTYDEFVAENGQRMANTMHPDDVVRVEQVISDAFRVGNEYTVEYRMRKKDGSYIWVRDIGRKTVATDGRTAMVSIIADISTDKKRQLRLEHAIETLKTERRAIDRLTGLLTRGPAETLIEQHLEKYHAGAFFFVDIDNFKMVNDAKGHPAGDQVLVNFANQLRQVFPPDAVLTRLGGDEFVAFLPQSDDLDKLRSLADNLLVQSKKLIEDEVLAEKLGASIGISMAPQDGDTFSELYGCADKAQYYAKQNGKGRYSFYKRQSYYFQEMSQYQLNIQNLCRIVKGVQAEKGAFFVEYETFQKVCQFMERNVARMQHNTQIMLFSLQLPRCPASDWNNLNEKRDALEQAVRGDLRSGDLMLNISPSQIVALLVNCDTEYASMVAKRVLNTYSHSENAAEMPVSYEFFGIADSR